VRLTGSKGKEVRREKIDEELHVLLNTSTVLLFQCSTAFFLKSGCERKPGKMLKTSTEGGQQNKFILTS